METTTVNAQDFANGLEFPVFFYAGVGCAGGQSIAILGDSELPVDLNEVEGVVTDGQFEANNLTSGPGAHDWKFSDWNCNTIYKIQIFNDESIWNKQNDDYNESAGIGFVAGTQIKHDPSGVGHAWRNISREDIPANIVEEIEGEIIDGEKKSCDDFIASNGLHYQW